MAAPVRNADGKYACEVKGCNYQIATLSTFKAHQIAKHGAPKLRCDEPGCDRLFNDKTILNRHKRDVHATKEGTFWCERCNKKLARKDNAKRHEQKSGGRCIVTIKETGLRVDFSRPTQRAATQPVVAHPFAPAPAPTLLPTDPALSSNAAIEVASDFDFNSPIGQDWLLVDSAYGSSPDLWILNTGYGMVGGNLRPAPMQSSHQDNLTAPVPDPLSANNRPATQQEIDFMRPLMNFVAASQGQDPSAAAAGVENFEAVAQSSFDTVMQDMGTEQQQQQQQQTESAPHTDDEPEHGLGPTDEIPSVFPAQETDPMEEGRFDSTQPDYLDRVMNDPLSFYNDFNDPAGFFH